MSFPGERLRGLKKACGAFAAPGLATFAFVAQLAVPFLHTLQIDREIPIQVAFGAPVAGPAVALIGDAAPQRSGHHDSNTCAVCQTLQHTRYSLAPARVVAATIVINPESRIPISAAATWAIHVETPFGPRAPPVLA